MCYNYDTEESEVEESEVEEALKSVNQADLSVEQKKDLRQYISVSIFQSKTLDLVKKAVAA